jgi:multidrug efflux system outer membrane protein
MRAFTALTVALLLAGCMVGPDYHRPAIDAPGAYRVDSQASIASPESLGDEKWWEVFQDPVLQQLIRTAL